jgi:hypothetical protein
MTRYCVVALLAVAAFIVAPARALGCAALPSSIQVDAMLESVVNDLLASSPTLARQCERIEAAGNVRVSIRALPKGDESCCRARTTIRRFASGAIIAWIEIPTLRRWLEHAELFGHEFEHVLEQMDMVDLAGPLDQGGGSRLWDGAYETARARRAGETVALEAALRETTSAARRPPR